MKRGKKIIKNVMDFLSSNQGIDKKRYIEIFKLVQPFLDKFDSEDLDFETIAKLESLIGFELVIIPTKQEWHKIKLEHLNNIDLNNIENEE